MVPSSLSGTCVRSEEELRLISHLPSSRRNILRIPRTFWNLFTVEVNINKHYFANEIERIIIDTYVLVVVCEHIICFAAFFSKRDVRCVSSTVNLTRK